MKKDYPYFQVLLLSWYQGHKTGHEIKEETKDFLDFEQFEKEFDEFIYILEASVDEYDDDIGYAWEDYKEYAKDTAPTVGGLCHNIDEVLAGNQSIEELIDWAAWHNLDGGETTAGVFENENIEYYCLDFLPENDEKIDNNVLKASIPIIKESHLLSHDSFAKKVSTLL